MSCAWSKLCNESKLAQYNVHNNVKWHNSVKNVQAGADNMNIYMYSVHAWSMLHNENNWPDTTTMIM